MTDRRLYIGECKIDGEYYPVYATENDNIIKNYPNSHHFNNLPLKLKKPKKNKNKKDDDDEEGQYV